MEFEYKNNTIKFERELSNLDELVLRFTRILDRQKIKYVLVSGYVAILFGRSRQTEDIDLFIEKISFEKFEQLWKEIYAKGFECINDSNPKDAYDYYLNDSLALRFALKGTFIWNFKVKFPKDDLNQHSLENRVKVELNNETIYIGPMELQIAYKLYLGSEKDIEDAIYLWEIFKTTLNKELFEKFVQKLKVQDKIKELEGAK
ncbi:MAG: hypothetical protein HY392_05010 [Candidatus Diapherotrites archaeon]|nr:hypothetical protein [Candidatus Diapherotrites archaeon]